MRSVSINMHGVQSVSIGKSIPYSDLEGNYRVLTIIDNDGGRSYVTLMSDDSAHPVAVIMENEND